MAPFPAFHWSLLYHSMTHLDVSDQLMPVDAGSHIWLSFKDQKWKLSKSNIVQKLCKVSTVVRWLKSNKLLYLAQKLSETFNNFLFCSQIFYFFLQIFIFFFKFPNFIEISNFFSPNFQFAIVNFEFQFENHSWSPIS